MAHEFASYQGAVGPEGVRRTVTYYGPIIGALPIEAWHCEVCGLLLLTYPDGRKEERRLFPGPQPGLLAQPRVEIVESEYFGLQARVSGLSIPDSVYAGLAAEELPAAAAITLRLPTITLPELNAATWLTVGLLAVTAFGLFLAGIVAVYDYATPGAETPLVITTAMCGLGAILVQAGAAAIKFLFPMPLLRPSIAVTERGQPAMDPATKLVVALLALTATGLLLTGFLAVYTTQTPDIEGGVAIATVACAGLAGAVKLTSVLARGRHTT